MIRSSCLLGLALSSLVGAQNVSYVTPPGSEFYEGNSSSNIMLGNLGANTRVQQVDSNLIGRFLPIVTSLAWRRNSGGGQQPKTTTLEVLMSHADINNVTSTFAGNYLGTPQTVFAARPINLPDWTASLSPARFDARVPFDSPFVYNGTDSLLWEVTKTNDPGSSYSQDWISSAPADAYGDFPMELNFGCSTPNGLMTHRTALRHRAGNLDFGFRVEGAPANTPVTVLLGFLDPNAAIPGLCANIRVVPEASVPLGSADAQGHVDLVFPFSLAWDPAFAGAPLLTQAYALDPSQGAVGVALSGGLTSPAPTSTTAAPLGILRLYSTTSATAVTGTGPTASAAPTEYRL